MFLAKMVQQKLQHQLVFHTILLIAAVPALSLIIDNATRARRNTCCQRSARSWQPPKNSCVSNFDFFEILAFPG